MDCPILFEAQIKKYLCHRTVYQAKAKTDVTNSLSQRLITGLRARITLTHFNFWAGQVDRLLLEVTIEMSSGRQRLHSRSQAAIHEEARHCFDKDLFFSKAATIGLHHGQKLGDQRLGGKPSCNEQQSVWLFIV